MRLLMTWIGNVEPAISAHEDTVGGTKGESATAHNLYYVKLAMVLAWLKQLQLHRIRKPIQGMIESLFAAMQPNLSLRIAQI